MGMRDQNVDNAKRGQTRTKTDAAMQMPAWPVKGAWQAPGQVIVTPSTEANDDYQAGQRGQPGTNDWDNDWNDLGQ